MLYELLYKLLVQPKAGLSDIMERGNLLQAAGLVLAGSMLGIISNMNLSPGSSFGSCILVAGGLSGLLSWLLATAVLHVSATLLGGKGDVRKLLLLLGFTSFVEIVLLPGYFMASLLASAAADLLVLGISFIWLLFLYLWSLQLVYGLPLARGLLTLFLSLLSVLCLLLCWFFLLAEFCTPLFMAAWPALQL